MILFWIVLNKRWMKEEQDTICMEGSSLPKEQSRPVEQCCSELLQQCTFYPDLGAIVGFLRLCLVVAYCFHRLRTKNAYGR